MHLNYVRQNYKIINKSSDLFNKLILTYFTRITKKNFLVHVLLPLGI